MWSVVRYVTNWYSLAAVAIVAGVWAVVKICQIRANRLPPDQAVRAKRNSLIAVVICVLAALAAVVMVVFHFKPATSLRNASLPVLEQALADGETDALAALAEIDRRLARDDPEGPDLVDVLGREGLGSAHSHNVRAESLQALLRQIDDGRWGVKAIGYAASVYLSLGRGDDPLPERDERRRRDIDAAFGDLWCRDDALFRKVLVQGDPPLDTRVYLTGFLERRIAAADNAKLAQSLLAGVARKAPLPGSKVP